MKRFLSGYVVGTLTAPIVFYTFRNPIIKNTKIFSWFMILADEEMDEKLFEIMSLRNDWQDLKQKYGEQVKQMKAQGYSVSEIADIIGHSEKAVRILLSRKS